MKIDNKIEPLDLMYFIELVASDSEQNSAFRLEAILTLCKLNGNVKEFKV